MSNGLRKNRNSDLDMKSSYGTTSDSDGVQSNGVSIISELYQFLSKKDFLNK
jgi:hypothetical protein